MAGRWALLAASLLATPASAADRPTQAVFISDLHFGAGRVDAQGNPKPQTCDESPSTSGKWDKFEDFRWTPSLCSFLDWLEQQGDTELVLVGDRMGVRLTSGRPVTSTLV